VHGFVPTKNSGNKQRLKRLLGLLYCGRPQLVAGMQRQILSETLLMARACSVPKKLIPGMVDGGPVEL